MIVARLDEVRTLMPLQVKAQQLRGGALNGEVVRFQTSVIWNVGSAILNSSEGTAS
jgi:hypothetical protein